MKKFIFLLLSLFVLSNSYATPSKPDEALYVVVSPMPVEARYLRSQMNNKTIIKKLGISYLKGDIEGRQVISVISGYGKVNITAVTSRILASFKPTIVILAETSGSVNKKLRIGDVVVGDTLFDTDFGELTEKGPVLPILIDNPINHKKEPMIYRAPDSLLKVAQETAKHFSHNERIVFGTIADGDFLPNPAWQLKLLRKNNVQAIAMDGVPVTKLGWIFNTPTLVLHSIANIAGEEIIDSNTELAADNTGKYLVNIIKRLPTANFHI